MSTVHKRKVKYTKRSAFFPCGICRKNCTSKSVQCNCCGYWYHYDCEQISVNDIPYVEDHLMEFTCVECFKFELGDHYSYSSALSRLRQASMSGFRALLYASRLETRAMPNECPTVPLPEITPSKPLAIDQHSQYLLEQHDMGRIGTPIVTTGDGNCLFNAASVATYGHENFSSLLRVRTCIQMCLNEETYLRRSDAGDLHLISPDYRDACIASSTDGSYSSAWTIMALADVLKTTIISIYPPVNGLQDHAFLHLNTSFKPNEPIHGTGEIRIMWTNTAINNKGYWTPNHFVSVIPNIYSVCDEFNPKFNSTFAHESPPQSPTPSSSIYSTTFPIASTSPMSSSNISSSELHMSFPDSPVDDIRKNDLFDQDYIHTQAITELDVDSMSSSNVVSDFECLPNGKFMSAKEAYLRIKEGKRIFEECPTGNKSNAWLLVNNKLNVLRYSKGLKREYYDDCGIWNYKNCRSHIQDYSRVDLKCIFKKGDSYCTRHVKSGKTVYLPVQPQPDVITMHRYQTVLKSDASFKKHVTYFTSTDDTNLSDVALYEYEGIYKVNETEKLRTNPKTFQNIKDEIKVKPPKNIYVDLNRDNSLLGPKDTKQIRNLKYRENKKTEVPSANVADEILCVLKMLNEHPFVQHVSHRKNKVPSIICYTEDQLADLKFFLKNSDSPIIGVDRTFNLGPFFVTCLVYKNNRVLRRETNDHPIFIGPMLLHKDATYATYKEFFSHLATEVSIEDFEIRFDQSIEFGTDNERAMTKAIEHSFPNATRRLCTKHLKDNIKFYLQNKVGVNSKLRNEIMEHIFGDSGLVNADDSITFERRSIEIKSLCVNFEQFINYFEKVLKDRLDTYVFQPRRASHIKSSKLWTNNNAESINRVFKFAINWKPKSTPELIKKLFDCVDYQLMNLRAALHNTGDYKLTTTEKRYLVSEHYWRMKTTEQKRSIFLMFLTNKKRKNPPETIVSSDGNYQVPTIAQNVAKKPCQRKRPVNVRTRPR